MIAGSAWYCARRDEFLASEASSVVAHLASHATRDGWHIEPEQHEEWRASVGLLQEQLTRKIEVLQSVLTEPGLGAFACVVLEYDLRRRGLRIDCILLGNGIIAVLEFKRGDVLKAHVDQIENYCVNLLEFHAETRRLCEAHGIVLAPVLVQTGKGRKPRLSSNRGFMPAPWTAIARPASVASRTELAEVLLAALAARRGVVSFDYQVWLKSAFSPSSNILDAALSLYGQHDVSAIHRHSASIEQIEECAHDVLRLIRLSQQDRRNRIIFVSGTPGSGKTLLGLKVAFAQEFQRDTVFVTGNSPLVEVLQTALQKSYRRTQANRPGLAGYPKESARHVIANSTFKIVKAHIFLGERGTQTGSHDGRVVIFDEAQRTYEKGRLVLRSKLEDDEAALILRALERSYENGCVVVALLGHNQFINSGELGGAAWIRAAERHSWTCVASAETLALLPETDRQRLLAAPGLHEHFQHGHLAQSLRYYRNDGVEKWAAAVLDGDTAAAARAAAALEPDDCVWLTRDLAVAKSWARSRRIGEERIGLVGSGKGARLAAEGLFVGFKPSIADWMLCPDGDVRSSNSLETIQNQYQIQGLELDYTIVCWDLDLRREDGAWAAWAFNGAQWQRRRGDLAIAKNGYRVLLTRARRGMIVFVPRGDASGEDDTRPSSLYDAIADHLTACGAKKL